VLDSAVFSPVCDALLMKDARKRSRGISDIRETRTRRYDRAIRGRKGEGDGRIGKKTTTYRRTRSDSQEGSTISSVPIQQYKKKTTSTLSPPPLTGKRNHPLRVERNRPPPRFLIISHLQSENWLSVRDSNPQPGDW
jgi:hypothetical protein